MFRRKKYDWKEFFQKIHKGDKVEIIGTNCLMSGEIGKVIDVHNEFNIYVCLNISKSPYVFREQDLRVILDE